jgi:hypothetical protein
MQLVGHAIVTVDECALEVADIDVRCLQPHTSTHAKARKGEGFEISHCWIKLVEFEFFQRSPDLKRNLNRTLRTFSRRRIGSETLAIVTHLFQGRGLGSFDCKALGCDRGSKSLGRMMKVVVMMMISKTWVNLKTFRSYNKEWVVKYDGNYLSRRAHGHEAAFSRNP